MLGKIYFFKYSVFFIFFDINLIFVILNFCVVNGVIFIVVLVILSILIKVKMMIV